MIPAEQRLLDHLRANCLNSQHFRWQQIIAGFSVDFNCRRAGCVIEVDRQIDVKQEAQDAAHRMRMFLYVSGMVKRFAVCRLK